MLTFEREIAALLPPETAAPLIARERRDVVSVSTEVRAMAWIGVMLIATGAGIIVSKNLERIGPITIAAIIGAVSLGCYAWSGWRRDPSRVGVTLDDYILLLGALLLSTDLGYIEHQWHLLGSEWPRHFLVLAVIHGVTAYLFGSSMLLSLSIAAFASWLGIERRFDPFFRDATGMALRAFTCAAVVMLGRVANRRRDFERVFDHFAANFALWGGLILTVQDDTREAGLLVVLVLAVVVILHGFRKREELFALYAYVYAVIATDIVVCSHVHDEFMVTTYLLVSTIVAIAGLFRLHAQFRRTVS